MGIWGWITGAQQIDKAMDIAKESTSGIIAGIDAAWFTPEEKSRAALELTQAAIEMVVATQGESTTRSITRRVLAWMIMSTFLFLLLFGTMIYRIDPEWSAYCLNSAKTLVFLATPVSVFYFGWYGVKQLRGKK
ncbi:MAG: hypothetical protein ACYS8I_09230 [Planctomycetota bacterium]|jgi:hypothetical protein